MNDSVVVVVEVEVEGGGMVSESSRALISKKALSYNLLRSALYNIAAL